MNESSYKYSQRQVGSFNIELSRQRVLEAKHFKNIFSSMYRFIKCVYRLVTAFKLGLHTSRKDRKHMFANTLSRMPWSSHSCNDRRYSYFTRNVCNRYVFDFKTLFIKHDRKHVPQLLRLYGDQALFP